MNTNGLARLYDQLGAQERFVLLLSAAARHDEVERARLMQSAPRFTLSAPHTWPRVDAFVTLAKLHFMELLELAGFYLELCSVAAATKPKRKDDVLGQWRDAMMMGYLFTTQLQGWRHFCAGLNVPAELLWESFPGYRTIQRAERMAGTDPETGFPGPAYVEEGAARYLARQALGDPEADVKDIWEQHRPITASDIAASLRTAWEELLRRWEARTG